MTRRKALENVNVHAASNCSLWFHKYDSPEESTENIKTSVDIPVPEEYSHFYNMWKKSLTEQNAFICEAKVISRMAIGMGNESVFENSITLHRTYGVPYIPGSALKGLSAHYARNHLENWSENSDAYKLVFGNDEQAGSVTFFDALYVPKSDKKDLPLKKDIMTPHHQDYINTKEEKPPADYDSPVPIPFISATGSYLIAIAGPEKLIQPVSKIMKMALMEEGIGSKTSSGYGRIEIISP